MDATKFYAEVDYDGHVCIHYGGEYHYIPLFLNNDYYDKQFNSIEINGKVYIRFPFGNYRIDLNNFTE